MGGVSCPAHGDKIYWMENASSDLSNNIRARNACSVQLDVTNVTPRPRPASFLFIFFCCHGIVSIFFFLFFIIRQMESKLKSKNPYVQGHEIALC